jgi:hypothetical protein
VSFIHIFPIHGAPYADNQPRSIGAEHLPRPINWPVCSSSDTMCEVSTYRRWYVVCRMSDAGCLMSFYAYLLCHTLLLCYMPYVVCLLMLISYSFTVFLYSSPMPYTSISFTVFLYSSPTLLLSFYTHLLLFYCLFILISYTSISSKAPAQTAAPS